MELEHSLQMFFLPRFVYEATIPPSGPHILTESISLDQVAQFPPSTEIIKKT